MTIARLNLLVLFFGLGLQACSSPYLSGPSEILDPNGPSSETPDHRGQYPHGFKPGTPNPSYSAGQFGLFEMSYAAAMSDQQTISSGKPLPAADISARARQMALDGANLVDANCEDFFRARGSAETFLNVARDTTAASGSLASGVLSLASPANAVAAGVISLVTSTASNGLDIYTKNFLFGSDNIESVRAMTINALATHRAKAFPLNDTSLWDFGGAVTVIMDHQDLCTPANIRSLALASISNSKLETKAETPDAGDVGGDAGNAAAKVAPTVAKAPAVVAPAAVEAMSAAANAASAATQSASATPESIEAAATSAAEKAMTPAIKAKLPHLSVDQQTQIVGAAAAVVGKAAAQAVQSGQSQNRHIQVVVAK